MNKKTSLSELRSIMFDVIDRLMASNDPEADDKDKISLELAEQVCEAGKVIVSAAKVEVDALKVVSGGDVPTAWFKNMKSSILEIPEHINP